MILTPFVDQCSHMGMVNQRGHQACVTSGNLSRMWFKLGLLLPYRVGALLHQKIVRMNELE